MSKECIGLLIFIFIRQLWFIQNQSHGPASLVGHFYVNNYGYYYRAIISERCLDVNPKQLVERGVYWGHYWRHDQKFSTCGTWMRQWNKGIGRKKGDPSRWPVGKSNCCNQNLYAWRYTPRKNHMEKSVRKRLRVHYQPSELMSFCLQQIKE